MIRNLTKRKNLSERTFFALKMRDRIRGMIGRRFDSFDAMVFPDCSAIHTFFMSMPIDVIFIDRKNTVVKVCRSLRPWRPCIMAWGAVTVIEMPQGMLDDVSVEPGDLLELKEDTATVSCEKTKFHTHLQSLQRRTYS